MEIRPYVVEQHFGSELVDIEIVLDLWKPGLKQTKWKRNAAKQSISF